MDISKQRITVTIEPFRGEENYELWALRLDSLLAREGLRNHIKLRDFGASPIMEGEEALNENQDSIRSSSIIKLNLANGPLL